MHNLHLPGHHKSTDPTRMLRPLNQLLALELMTLLDGDESLRPLPPMRIRYCYNADFEDRGVCG